MEFVLIIKALIQQPKNQLIYSTISLEQKQKNHLIILVDAGKIDKIKYIFFILTLK